MLFGEYETVEEFLAFLCKACFASFSFAHRIVWFLKSLMNPYNPYNERIRTILHLIQTIFKSESRISVLERLHVAGSKKYLECLNKFRELNSKEGESQNNQILLSMKPQIRERLDEYINRQYSELVPHEEKFEIIGTTKPEQNIVNSTTFRIESEDIFINTFKRYDSVTNDENNILTQYVKQIDMDDINLSSFLSNINFIDHLCNICEILRSTAIPNQNKTLLNELMKVNKILPANVYMPFLKDSIRNYVIASIPLSEVKIYRTKNRAPYMITLECLRLDELTFNLMNENDKKEKNERKSSISSNSSENDEEENLKTCEDRKLEIGLKRKHKTERKSVGLGNTTRDDFNLKKNNTSMKDSLLSSHSEKANSKPGLFEKNVEKLNLSSEKDNPNKSQDMLEHINLSYRKSDFYTAIRDKKTKTFLEPTSNQSKDFRRMTLNPQNKNSQRLSKINYLLESDINISRPVVIKNILNTQSSQNNSINLEKEFSTPGRKKQKQAALLLYEGLDIETDPEDYKKIDKVVKDEVRDLNNTANLSMNVSDEKIEIPDIKHNLLITESDEEINFKTKSKNTEKKLLEEKEGNLEILENKSENLEVQDNIILSTKNEFYQGMQSFFGEKIEAQTERLKKISPFGGLNTYKLFKIIVKSGEDLRQEQFATQLINEFYQIFKIEKVECWVNPYEILATGNNVGIIEVVPNSVSIDQLKRKNKLINTLRGFYENYFGPINSDNYKKAMKNFISSLAGYSLVCYFLQIKDRHNANIMIDDKGHIIHIDFGFMLSNAPGKGLQFERAPFKLTKEFVDVMGGVNSKYFTKFRKLLWK
jgi:hypothetical protein